MHTMSQQAHNELTSAVDNVRDAIDGLTELVKANLPAERLRHVRQLSLQEQLLRVAVAAVEIAE